LPLTARLDLSPDVDGRATLYADDIARIPFRHTQLVVLAACSTAYGANRRGEGVFSLARPFLSAGVPTVLATLWNVDDEAASRLFLAFHQQLRLHAGAAKALRAAQLEMLAGADERFRLPHAWAAAIAIGGVDE
jgi:CHAT domain-containing protein